LDFATCWFLDHPTSSPMLRSRSILCLFFIICNEQSTMSSRCATEDVGEERNITILQSTKETWAGLATKHRIKMFAWYSRTGHPLLANYMCTTHGSHFTQHPNYLHHP
jgi:hypothetical protein